MADKLFYVYELFNELGIVEYVGKGYGARLQKQKRAHNLDGRKVQEFASEDAAFAFEIQHIASVKPVRNKCSGGNGGRVGAGYLSVIKKLGTQRYAARLLMLCIGKNEYHPDESTVERLRRVAYG